MRYLLTLLLLLPTASYAMLHRYHRYESYQHFPTLMALNALTLHSLPSQMDITAEMAIPQKKGLRTVSRYLYFKQQSDELVPTPGGLIAGHQNTEAYDLEIILNTLNRATGNAKFICTVTHTGGSHDDLITISFTSSSTKTYTLPMKDEYDNPITLIIKSTVKK